MRVDAGPVARLFALVDGRPRTTALVVDGREVPLGADEEVAVVVDGRRRPDTGMTVSGIDEAPDGGRLAWTLDGPNGLSVGVVVEADRASGVVRKRVEVTGRGTLHGVELERWSAGDAARFAGFESTGEPVAYNEGPVGLGQPVFGPGFFAGIEHPVAENLVAARGSGVTCALPMAADLGAGPVASPAAVVGAGGLDGFWDYVDTLRPVAPRLVTLANNWYHLGATGRMDEATVRAEVAGFAQVAEEHGLALDFVCLDDGWEGEWDAATGLWGRMAPSRFPAGMAPLGPGIGLWLSPFGGYGERRQQRVAWAYHHGFEVDPADRSLCVAGANYRAHLVDALTAWTRAGVGYWKLDGVRFVCPDRHHGHPVGPGARTAQVDSFLDVVARIRAVRPDAVLAFTIGSHPSPWWLGAVDFLWRGGLDDTAAEQPGSRLDRFDSYIDACLHSYRRAALPVSALVTFSIVESAAASYREAEAGGGLDAWERHCWLAVGRGTLHQDLYVAPDSLSPAEWAALARALAWARAHEPLLARSRMVLGNPGAGEVYGFVGRRAHAGAVAATACFRNPSDRAQAVDLDWPALLGVAPGSPVALTARHGRAPEAGGRLTLDPFAVVVLEARSPG